MTEQDAREILRSFGMRATTPRIQVMIALASLKAPVAYTELLQHMGDLPWDPATVYRNLLKLSEAGICVELAQAGGMTRYALAKNDSGEQNRHEHPHFICESCGDVECLPLTLSVDVPSHWVDAVRAASIQLSGECPKCIETHHTQSKKSTFSDS